MKKRYTIVTIVLVAAIVFVGVVFVIEPYFLNPDQTLYNEAKRLQSEGKYSEALTKYQSLQSNYPSSYYAVISYDEVLNCRYLCISSSISDKNYDAAQQQYTQLLSSYSVAVATVERDIVLKDMPPEVLYAWAKTLETQNATLSIRVYGALVKYYPDSQYTSEAETTIINLELEKISQQGKFIDFSSSAYHTIPTQLNGKTQVTVINDSPHPLTVYLKGSVTKMVVIDASPNSSINILNPNDLLGIMKAREQANRVTITLDPGTYEMALRTNASKGMYGTATFSGDMTYEYCFYETT
ncbi:MAG: outer membrane protein assembly factor BamD [Candidatus Bathyarchaeota archaeon]|nr:outer membrane protein assembly factor BamD [Candidatus Bathyarchaeota archaeon]